MIKYLSKAITFAEVPDEITLCLQITNCPHRCEGCHSPELRENCGVELTKAKLAELLTEHADVTCVCFMGGDSDHEQIGNLANFVKASGKKVAMYSGDDAYDEELAKYLDYYKVGHYDEKLGPLNKYTTNQRFYELPGKIDITHRFWNK